MNGHRSAAESWPHVWLQLEKIPNKPRKRVKALEEGKRAAGGISAPRRLAEQAGLPDGHTRQGFLCSSTSLQVLIAVSSSLRSSLIDEVFPASCQRNCVQRGRVWRGCWEREAAAESPATRRGMCVSYCYRLRPWRSRASCWSHLSNTAVVCEQGKALHGCKRLPKLASGHIK